MSEKEKEFEQEEDFVNCEGSNCNTNTDEVEKKEEDKKEKEPEMTELEKLTIENEKLKAEVLNLQGDYLRKNAEFQNFKKRLEKEMEELRKYASEKVMVKLLDNVDNLERAIASSSETKDFDSLIKGVEMTLTQMKGIMNSEGVEEVETLGKPFDANIHHPVQVEASADHDNDVVMQVFSKAYKMKDKIIRPAMVKVCKK